MTRSGPLLTASMVRCRASPAAKSSARPPTAAGPAGDAPTGSSRHHSSPGRRGSSLGPTTSRWQAVSRIDSPRRCERRSRSNRRAGSVGSTTPGEVSASPGTGGTLGINCSPAPPVNVAAPRVRQRRRSGIPAPRRPDDRCVADSGTSRRPAQRTGIGSAVRTFRGHPVRTQPAHKPGGRSWLLSIRRFGGDDAADGTCGWRGGTLAPGIWPGRW